MLINEPLVLQQSNDPILKMIGLIHGNKESYQISEGVYQIASFGSSDFLRNYERYPDITTGCFGVCDNWEQVVEQNPEIKDPDRKFVITVTPVLKATQSPDGGWRWHKWGQYIGTQNRSGCEYLYDEPEIEQVLCYHVYEKK